MNDSFTINKRFTVSLISNLIKSAVSFTTGILLARWLGPDDYGRMAFLIASFLAFKQLFDMATSSAFFTFLSQRSRSKQFIRYFWYWVGAQFTVSILFVALILPEDILQKVWVGEQKTLIILALIATFMQHHVWSIASQMAEASRQTIWVQKLNVLVVLLHLCVVVSLWLIGELILPLIFVALIVEWSIAGWIASRMYQKESVLGSDSIVDTPKSVFKEFWRYCMPFVPYSLLSFMHIFADRWMLQHWGGANEQAYYAVAQQFSAVALLATSSILRIFWKEVAEAQHQKDTAKVERLYFKVSRILFFIGTIIAAGLIPWSKEIVTVLLGDAYLAGVVTLMIMFLYPIHQSLGQIGNSLLYATERVKIQVVMGLIFLSSKMIVSYFMLAPKDMFIPGLGLASEGLAIKMVVSQWIIVNIQAYVIARVFGWKYDWLYQLVGLLIVIIMAYAAQMVGFYIFEDFIIMQFIISGLIYLLMIISVLYYFPWLAGLKRKEVTKYVEKIRRKYYG